MHTAAIIIPRPPVISKYFNASIVVLLCASAPVPDLHRHRLRNHLPDRLPDRLSNRLSNKEQPEHLPENKFLCQHRHRHRKNQARHQRHECDHHLHDALLRKNLNFALLLPNYLLTTPVPGTRYSYCPLVSAETCTPATSSSPPPNTCAISSSLSPRISTTSPTRNIAYNRSTSRFRSRMHPCDAACPIDRG